MLLLDYDTTVRHQFEDLHKSRRKINFFFNNPLGSISQWINTLIQKLIEKAIAQINDRLTTQLFHSKGILADLQSKATELQGKDFNTFIRKIDDLIIQHVSFTHEIEVIIEADKRSKFPQILLTDSLLKEIIEVQYDILRILKRYNNNSSRETSELAVESSKRSLISLQTTANGRRTT
ncbi:MAG: hypothetical protein J7578_04060 [Chitinophagaceae bacterium]|nr:hypothetical protein [Chitinophagaceae bacterium]